MNNYLSTGQIAKYCGVHIRTVIRWIEQGHLKGYKLPGRGNNRVELLAFIDFLNANNMPIPAELAPQRRRVLIIEDDVFMAKLIMLTFQAEGWETFYAADGFQAGLTLAKTPIDLMTLDLMMPTMDGFSVLSFIAQDPELQKTPVIVISGSNEDLLNRAKAAGAAAVLEKPLDEKRLIEVASRLLEQKTSALAKSRKSAF